jgi:hypothetical protein
MATPPSHTSPADSSAAVDAFMAATDHACTTEIQALRASLLRVDPRIAEGIKWKSPSFRTTEYFATINLREKNGVGLILHFGAKVRELPQDIAIPDPERLLKWLAKDRAMIVFKNDADFKLKQAAFEALIGQWIHYV